MGSWGSAYPLAGHKGNDDYIQDNAALAAVALGGRLSTGMLHINDQTVADDCVNPFGGRGCSGNGGSVGGPADIDEFTQWQWVTVQDVPNRYPF